MYYANRKLRIGTDKGVQDIYPGEPVPGAEDWPTLTRYLNRGDLVWIDDGLDRRKKNQSNNDSAVDALGAESPKSDKSKRGKRSSTKKAGTKAEPKTIKAKSE